MKRKPGRARTRRRSSSLKRAAVTADDGSPLSLIMRSTASSSPAGMAARTAASREGVQGLPLFLRDFLFVGKRKLTHVVDDVGGVGDESGTVADELVATGGGGFVDGAGTAKMGLPYSDARFAVISEPDQAGHSVTRTAWLHAATIRLRMGNVCLSGGLLTGTRK